VHRRPGRSAGCRRRVDQPASAGLGTEPGRSRPGDRGYGRSADLRCVSCETCRPRCIAASCGAGGRGTASPLQRGRPSPLRRVANTHRWCAAPCHVGVRRCLTRPARQGRRTRADGHRGAVIDRRAGSRPRGIAAPVARRARQRLAPTTWATHPRSGIRVRQAAATPFCRGQAVPDPSGPPGPADHHRRATAVGRDHRRMPGCDPHVPRLVARRARQRLAPT
jgi:hypothetical protein